MNSCFYKRNNYWERQITQSQIVFESSCRCVQLLQDNAVLLWHRSHLPWANDRIKPNGTWSMCVCGCVCVRLHSFLFMCLGEETNESAMSYYLYHSSALCNNKSQHCRAPAGRCNTIHSPLMTRTPITYNSSFRPCPKYSGYFHEENVCKHSQQLSLDNWVYFLPTGSRIKN